MEENTSKNIKAGLYMCITEGFYCQIPFPDVISSTNENYKNKSTKCKYGTYEQCYSRRCDLAQFHKSEIRTCNFAHIGEKYNKLGTMYRCPSLEHFGNHKTLTQDIQNATITDIKHILMNSLSDIMLAAIWYQNNPKAYYSKPNQRMVVLSDLDRCS
jgi:hypothetical protein